ncbi:MAG: winged helix-turn-helix transcriptional regulator [Deltaproteobacteria bacterium]|nr:winged helix-turn-helix transcriptional regulator [Deltaproteobacteria bacterium]
MSVPESMIKHSAVFKALGHPTRLFIIQLLSEKDWCVQELTAKTEFDISTISKHLSVMKQCGLVASRREGNCHYYSLKIKCVGTFLNCLDGLQHPLHEQENGSKCCCGENKI